MIMASWNVFSLCVSLSNDNFVIWYLFSRTLWLFASRSQMIENQNGCGSKNASASAEKVNEKKSWGMLDIILHLYNSSVQKKLSHKCVWDALWYYSVTPVMIRLFLMSIFSVKHNVIEWWCTLSIPLYIFVCLCW